MSNLDFLVLLDYSVQEIQGFRLARLRRLYLTALGIECMRR